MFFYVVFSLIFEIPTFFMLLQTILWARTPAILGSFLLGMCHFDGFEHPNMPLTRPNTHSRHARANFAHASRTLRSMCCVRPPLRCSISRWTTPCGSWSHSPPAQARRGVCGGLRGARGTDGSWKESWRWEGSHTERWMSRPDFLWILLSSDQGQLFVYLFCI